MYKYFQTSEVNKYIVYYNDKKSCECSVKTQQGLVDTVVLVKPKPKMADVSPC